MASDRRFSRGSWAVLAFVLGLALLDVASLAVRFALPTDGWVFYTESINGENSERQVFDQNLVGGPTPLQAGDRLDGLNDLSIGSPFDLPPAAISALHADWAAGRPLRYTVLRDGQTVTVEVPPKHWTLAAWLAQNFGSIASAANSLIGLVVISVALLTFFKRPGNPAARALLLFCAAVFLNGLSSSLPDGVSVVLNPFTLFVTSFFSYVIFATLLAPSLLLFTLVFPRPKAFVERWPGWLLAPFAPALGVVVAIYTLNLAVVGWLATMAMFMLSLALLVHSGFTARDAISRAQMRWMIGGFGLGLAISLTTYVPIFIAVNSPLAELLGSGVLIGFAIIGISLSVAVLRYRLFDIDLIIRRTLAYTVLTAALALVYFGSVILLQTLFRSLTGQGSQLAVVASTLAIAALFSPLRRRVQDFIDRRFFRRKYDAARTLSAFAATARDETDLDRLTGRLVTVVEETMQPASVSLWLARRPPGR